MKTSFRTRPESIEVDLESAAVVVVDMQNAFASQGGVFDLAGIDIAPVRRIIRTIQGILSQARERGVSVFYLKMGYRKDLSDSGGPDSPNWQKEYALRLMRDYPGMEGKLLVEGTWDFEIVEGLKPHPGDTVVIKSRYSGFAGTNLDSLLRVRRIRFLFFVGLAANVCVESTIRDAYCLDYWPVLITDATMQAGSDVLQQATVQNVENHFGWTTTAQEFSNALASRA